MKLCELNSPLADRLRGVLATCSAHPFIEFHHNAARSDTVPGLHEESRRREVIHGSKPSEDSAEAWMLSGLKTLLRRSCSTCQTLPFADTALHKRTQLQIHSAKRAPHDEISGKTLSNGTVTWVTCCVSQCSGGKSSSSIASTPPVCLLESVAAACTGAENLQHVHLRLLLLH